MTTVMIAGGGTGGHLMPALAIAAELQRQDPAIRVVLVGAERGLEATLLPTRSWPFHLLPLEPIYRRQWWRNARWPWLAWRVVRAVDRVLDQECPGVVLGTGGYASGPVVWRAAARGIPTAILEQDAEPGLATRWLARRAREVYLALPEAATRLRLGARTGCHVTGAPIIPPDPALRLDAAQRLGLDPSHPVLLVTGGSQGSLALNQAVADWMGQGGAAGIQVLWSTGRLTHARFAAHHAPPGVTVVPFLDPIAPALAAATVAVTRAGSMTLAELCAWGIPAILVPLPTAALDHQTRNAAVLARAGAATMVRQAELTADRLHHEVRSLLDAPARREAMRRAALARARPDATAEISQRLRGVMAAS